MKRKAGARLHDEGEFTFVDAERAQLRAWVSLSASAKVDYFEEMIELAYRSGHCVWTGWR